MSGRSISVYTDTSALHEYLCTPIYKTDTYIVNYLSNDLKQSCFQISFGKLNVKSLKKLRKFCENQDGHRSVSMYADTFRHELLMSLIIICTTNIQPVNCRRYVAQEMATKRNHSGTL